MKENFAEEIRSIGLYLILDVRRFLQQISPVSRKKILWNVRARPRGSKERSKAEKREFEGKREGENGWKSFGKSCRGLDVGRTVADVPEGSKEKRDRWGDVARWFHILESRASRRSTGTWPNALSVLSWGRPLDYPSRWRANFF